VVVVGDAIGDAVEEEDAGSLAPVVGRVMLAAAAAVGVAAVLISSLCWIPMLLGPPILTRLLLLLPPAIGVGVAEVAAVVVRVLLLFVPLDFSSGVVNIS